MNDQDQVQKEGEEGRISFLRLVASVRRRAPMDAMLVLRDYPDDVVARVLSRLQHSHALKVLSCFNETRRAAIKLQADEGAAEQWSLNQAFERGTVGRLMERPVGVMTADITVQDAIEQVRVLAEDNLVTYVYVIDNGGRLIGIVSMRELALAERHETLEQVMLEDPFSLRPGTTLKDAISAVIRRHYPVYPVCDDNNVLVGLIKGFLLFEEHTLEISAQSGAMVGVEREERVTTPWEMSLKLRQPWLQLNLLTAFVAAAVVGYFEDTIAQIVALAVFLPVLAGQSGNTGSQALAVTLRGITLGHIRQLSFRQHVEKEAMLGLCNGALVGVTAAIGMFLYVTNTSGGNALALAVVVFLAMIGSCTVSGVTGVLVPLALKRLGADPATASAIFLTTATDVASMGLFLALATLMIL